MLGFSDPYCLLTILEDEEESRTRQSRAKPCKSVVKDAASQDKIFQTDVKKQTLNPIWNQTFILWVLPFTSMFLNEFGGLSNDQISPQGWYLFTGLKVFGKARDNVRH